MYSFEDFDGAKQQPRSADDQKSIIQIMLDLVKVDADDPSRDVRQQRERSELVRGSLERDRLIESLARGRLLTTSPGMAANDSEVDITHESLIRGWSRLEEAIKAERTQLEQRDRF